MSRNDSADYLPSTPAVEASAGAVPAAGHSRRILIIVENLPVPFDRRVWQEATALSAAGYQVSVICPMGKGYEAAHEIIEGIHVFRHPLPRERRGALGYLLEYGAALFWESLLTAKVALLRGFDVIHACNPPDLIVLVAAPYKVLNKRFVFDHHDINPELYAIKFGRKGLLYKLLLTLERLTFALADVSIATNASYRDIAIKRGGMPANRVFVVRSSPDSTKFRCATGVHQRRRDGKVVVGYIGIMGDQDGVDGLLRIASKVVHEHGRDDIDFVLIGDGPELQRLKAMAERLSLNQHVRFTGFLAGEALLTELARIDMGVVPDPKDEYTDKCTMNKVMEYMALGKPTVQYNLTEGRYSAGLSALYARPGDENDFADCILRLADDPKLRQELGKRGRLRFENELDWRFEVPHLLAAYETVFATKTSSAT